VKIKLKELFAATQGDQEKKVEVKRAWLTAVYNLIIEGERTKRELAELKSRIKIRDADKDFEEGWKDLEAGQEKIFGKGGAFEKIFGKGKDKFL